METTGAVLRWIWTYRAGLTPVFVAFALAAGGITLRMVAADTPMWARGGLILLAAVPPLLYASRIAKWWLRWWDALLTLAAAIWLGWVALIHTDRLALAALGLAALAVLMWISMGLDADLRSRVRVQGRFRDWPDVAKRIGYPDIRWVMHKEIPGQGWTARLAWPAGAYDRDKVIRDVAAFEGARELPVGSLRLLHHGRSRNAVDAIFMADDPNTTRIEWPGPVAANQSVADPVPLGPHSDHTIATVTRYNKAEGSRRVLIGGATGSGKSGMIHQLIGESVNRTDVVQLGMDLKGGLELGLWEAVLLWMVSDIAGAIEMMRALEAAAEYRMAYMRSIKVRVWPVSPEFPAIEVTVDEIRRLAASTAGRTNKQQAILLDRLVDVATLGRAVGIGLLAAGQHLTLQALGTSQFSTQFDIRIGLRVNKEESGSYIFPDDPYVRLHEIPADQPGTGRVKDGDTLDPQPFRGYFWSDEMVAHVAELRAGGQPMLDRGTGDAMAAVSERFAAIWSRLTDWVPTEDTGGDTGGDDVDWSTIDEVDGDTTGSTTTVPAGAASADGGDIWDGPDPDVSWAAVVAARARRTGVPPVRALPEREPEKLPPEQARAVVRRMLREAGPQGCAPRELYRAVGYSSTWLHGVITQWDDEGEVVRTRHGRYADASAVARAEARS
jgi:S-DNA-T family DNA segregation ATPase FtsK/SpoIIIE